LAVLGTKSPDRDPDVDRVPATIIVSQEPSKQS
jgi:hypothetical protein